jgi:hypothetical protein
VTQDSRGQGFKYLFFKGFIYALSILASGFLPYLQFFLILQHLTRTPEPLTPRILIESPTLSEMMRIKIFGYLSKDPYLRDLTVKPVLKSVLGQSPQPQENAVR